MGPEAAYGVWEEQVVEVPERSRFYSLTPIGVGTPQVESLSGYVARLAEAHVISVGDLVGRHSMSGATSGSRERMTSSPIRRPGKQVFHATAYAINGVSARALKWVRILERLTCCRHLDALTLLPLGNTLSDMFLFKRWRAWCPQCYEADRESGTVYERLLWTLRLATICPVHIVALEAKCPFCHKALPPLAAHSRPGYCSSCRQWLGKQGGPSRPHPNPAEADYELYVATATGELLALCSTASRTSKARFSRNLRICIDRLASGNTKAFAKLTRASRALCSLGLPVICGLGLTCWYGSAFMGVFPLVPS
jgi:TniQ